MKSVRIKIDICEYYFEYETLEDIKNHFIKNNIPYIGLDTIDNYGGKASGKSVALTELSEVHINWADEYCSWGDRYLRGWKSK